MSKVDLHYELPDISNVKSKLDNVNTNYKPPTSNKRIETRKVSRNFKTILVENWKSEARERKRHIILILEISQPIDKAVQAYNLELNHLIIIHISKCLSSH